MKRRKDVNKKQLEIDLHVKTRKQERNLKILKGKISMALDLAKISQQKEKTDKMDYSKI